MSKKSILITVPIRITFCESLTHTYTCTHTHTLSPSFSKLTDLSSQTTISEEDQGEGNTLQSPKHQLHHSTESLEMRLLASKRWREKAPVADMAAPRLEEEEWYANAPLVSQLLSSFHHQLEFISTARMRWFFNQLKEAKNTWQQLGSAINATFTLLISNWLTGTLPFSTFSPISINLF